jgi:seryl-tRNA synthetase
MIDIKLLRENLDFVKGELQKRNGTISFEAWQKIDILQREPKGKIEALQARKTR